jgi:hypothetical protein
VATDGKVERLAQQSARPTLAEAAPDFAKAVQAALRKTGADALADQIPGLQVAAFCACAPQCSAFTSIADDRRPDGKVTTNFAMNTAQTGVVLVDAVGDVVVGLDVLDDGQLRMAVEGFAKQT